MRNKPVKISFWNCSGVSNKETELDHFLREHDIDVMLLSETHLKPSQNLTVPNYLVYRNDRKIQAGGRTAVLVKRSISHSQLPDPLLRRIEAKGVQIHIHIHGYSSLQVYSIYIPPGIDLPATELDTLLETGNPAIFGEDFNAKHALWNSKTQNQRGKQLAEYVEDRQLMVTAPPSATHISTAHNTTDVLDIALIRDVTFNWDIEVLDELP